MNEKNVKVVLVLQQKEVRVLKYLMNELENKLQRDMELVENEHTKGSEKRVGVIERRRNVIGKLSASLFTGQAQAGVFK